MEHLHPGQSVKSPSSGHPCPCMLALSFTRYSSCQTPKDWGSRRHTAEANQRKCRPVKVVLFSFQAHPRILEILLEVSCKSPGSRLPASFLMPRAGRRVFYWAPSLAVYILTKRIPDGVGNLLACHLSQSLRYYL